MKTKNIITAGLILQGLFLMGCQKYLDINKNPNGVEDPRESAILAGVTNGTAINVYSIGDLTGNYVQYLASPSPGSDYDVYNEVDGSDTWNRLYNTMTDLRILYDQATAKNLHAYAGVAQILMAFNLSMTTNVWGDIPYQDAFTGDSLNPSFDNQQAIYDTCLALVNAGISSLQEATTNELEPNSDFIYGGDGTKWIKMGYALKARLLNQVSQTSQYDPKKVLDALSQACASNEDDAQVTSFDGGNPWYNIAYNNKLLVLGGWLSSYFIDALNGTTYGIFDPRLPLITDTTEDGNYRGTPNGKGYQGPTNTEHYECYLDIDKWYSSSSSPIQLITYAECLFLKAEAAFRNGDKATAYDAYLEGIWTNMKKMGVDTAHIKSYLDNPGVSVGDNNITLALIMKEKYVACFLNPLTWDDMRRMDYKYKDFHLPYQAALPTFISRLNYPDDEISRNGRNVPQGIKLSDHLWWDK